MRTHVFFIMLCALCFLGCNTNTPSNSEISCDPTKYEVGEAGSEFIVTVKTSSAWTATANQTWVSISPNSAQGDAFVTVKVEKGPSGSAKVLFNNGSNSATLSISRAGGKIDPDPDPDTPKQDFEDGILPGLFSISEGIKVHFSQGNLQYQATTDTWRFATHQYDFVGEDNQNISKSYSGWIDLFGWGTGDNPTQASDNHDNYVNFTDWGVNPISNGGNKANMWRTMSKDEWDYMLNNRPNAINLRGQASINGIHGYVFLPDDSTVPKSKFTPNANDWLENSYTLDVWKNLEKDGAVFLPAAGYREEGRIYRSYLDCGYYQTSTPNLSDLEFENVIIVTHAFLFSFSSNGVGIYGGYMDYNETREGNSVRLVQEVK